MTSVELLAEAPGWLSYDLPDELLGIALKGSYRGQRQKWFAMRFTGREAEIDIAPRGGHKAEFDDWRWADVVRAAAPDRALQAAGLRRRGARVRARSWVRARRPPAVFAAACPRGLSENSMTRFDSY